MVKFDDTITAGSIVQMALLIGVFVKLYGEFAEIKTKVHAMWVVFMREHGERHGDSMIEMDGKEYR